MISWSQSDCAVQYMVAIINTTDDRVYSNIITNDSNTTVTLPTGVEFCVTVVGVDSIGRSGSPSEPKCYCKCVSMCCTLFHLIHKNFVFLFPQFCQYHLLPVPVLVLKSVLVQSPLKQVVCSFIFSSVDLSTSCLSFFTTTSITYYWYWCQHRSNW